MACYISVAVVLNFSAALLAQSLINFLLLKHCACCIDYFYQEKNDDYFHQEKSYACKS